MHFLTGLNIFLLIITVLCVSITIYAVWNGQQKIENKAYVLLLIAVLLLGVASILVFITRLIPPLENIENTIKVMISIINIFYGLGFLFLVNSLLFVLQDKLGFLAHLAFFFIGGSVFVLIDFSKITLSYNNIVKVWIVQYMLEKYTLVIPFVIVPIFVAYFVLYFYKKFKHNLQKKRLDLSIISSVLLVLWMISFNLGFTKAFRSILLPLALLTLGIDLLRNPLLLFIIDNSPDELLILSKNDKPILRYNFANKQVVEDIEEVRLLVASKIVLKESISAESEPNLISLVNKQIRTIKSDNLKFILIGEKLPSTIQSVFKYSLAQIEKQIDLTYLRDSDVLKKSHEEILLKKLKENLGLVLLSN